jgi:hypothetical protein
VNAREWLKTNEGRDWLRRKKGLEKPVRSQEHAEYLATVIEQFKAAKRSGTHFHMPGGLSAGDKKLIFGRTLGQVAIEQRGLSRPSPKRAKELIDQFMQENHQAR